MADGEDAMGPEDRHGLLVLASQHGRVGIAEKALEQEFNDPNGDVKALLHRPGPEDAEGNAPIHLACRGGHADLVGVLLRRGADIGLRNGEGQSAMELSRGIPKEAAIRSVVEMELIRRACVGELQGVEELLAGGVDPKCGGVGCRPSELAGKFGHADVQLRLELAEQGKPFASLDDAREAGGSPRAEEPPPPPSEPSSARWSRDGAVAPRRSEGGPPSGCGVFPLVWPPLCSARRSAAPPDCAGSRRDDGWLGLDRAQRVELPLAAGAPIEVALPPGLSAAEAAPLLGPLAEAFAGAASAPEHHRSAMNGSGRRPAPPAANAAGFPLGVPLLCPSFASTVGRHFLGGINGGAEGSGAGISLVVDRRLALPAEGFRIALRVGGAATRGSGAYSARADGQVEVAARDAAALRRGLQALRQLLLFEGAVDRLSGRLVLPACLVEDCPPQGVATQEPPSVYLDACALPAAAASEAVARLRGWRLRRGYVPVSVAARRPAGAQAALLRRIFALRCEAEAAGVELVPVVTLPAGESLAGEAAARDLLAQLAQLGCDGHLGVRCHADPSQGAVPEQILARLHAVHAIAASAFGATGSVLDVWLPAGDDEAIDAVCAAAVAGHFGPGASRLRILVECVADPTHGVPAEEAAAAAARVSDWGLSCAVFLAAAAASPAGAGRSPLVSWPPAVVWPGAGLLARAAAVEELRHSAEAGGARGVVAEVPVWGVPWLAPCGLASPSAGAWCELGALLAAGGAPWAQALGGGGADAGASRKAGRLLAAQLFGASPAAAGASAAAALALALWGAPRPVAPGGEAAPPPPEFLPLLLGLLSGTWASQAKRPEDAMGSVSAWYQHLYKRREHMRGVVRTDLFANVAMQPPAWVETARRSLQVSLTGLEWLLFACQLYMMMLKYSGLAAGPLASGDAMRAAVAKLPPAKLCDLQNSFLKVVECTSRQSDLAKGGVNTHSEAALATDAAQNGEDGLGLPSSIAHQELEALWAGGVRIGAALSLEPWLSFERAEQGAGRARA